MRVTQQEITEITGSEDVKQLTEISLANRYVDQLGFVCEMDQLQDLNLSFNDIHSLEGLAGCRSLRVLTVVHNKLKNLNGLQGLDELRCLRCSKNLIADVSATARLPQLQELWIQNNRVPHISNVVDNLGGLAHLQKLVLSPNPCSPLPEGDRVFPQPEIWKQYTLCSLRHLSVLDGQFVDEADRSAAEANLKTLEGSEALHVLLERVEAQRSRPKASLRGGAASPSLRLRSSAEKSASSTRSPSLGASQASDTTVSARGSPAESPRVMR